MVQNAKFAAAELSFVSAPAPVRGAYWNDDGNGFDCRCHGTRNLAFDMSSGFVIEARRRLPSP